MAMPPPPPSAPPPPVLSGPPSGFFRRPFKEPTPITIDDDHDEEFYKHLQELRVELQDFSNLLQAVRRGQATVKAYAAYIERTRQDVIALLESIEDGDVIRRLHNLWEQVLVCPLIATPEEEFPAQEQLHALEVLEEQLHQMLFQIGTLTIPARVNDWLAQARPGYYIPFHLVFEDEIPNPDDRLRIFNFLAWSPNAIQQGIVDINSGLIYRYSGDARARLLSILLLALGFLLATGLVVGAAYLPAQGWPFRPENLGVLIAGWGAILAGIITHVAVGSAKRRQAQGGLPPVIALGDLPLLINARVGQFLFKLLLALIGLFGLAFATGVAELTMLNTFLVGYSLDSFVELFAAGLERSAAAQTGDLKRRLGLNVE